MNRSNLQSIAPLAAATLMLALAGCGSGTYNAGLEPAHAPVVGTAEYVADFQTSEWGLAPGEAARIEHWFGSLALTSSDRISISNIAAYDNQGASEIIRGLASRHGVTAETLSSPDVPAGSIRVHVARRGASVPGCPDWSRPSQPEFGAANMSNHGCAINANLAAMIADPNDLLHGKSADLSDPASASKAIKTYRTKAPTGAGALKAETTKGD